MNKLRKMFLAVIFIFPFLQGLYFYHEAYLFTIIILILLIIALLMKEAINFNIVNLTLILIICGLYFIVSFFAIDKGMALLGALKAESILILFILYSLIYSEELREKALLSIIYSSMIMAILSILFIFYEPLKDYVFINERLGGFFQYANSYGIYCLVTIVLLMRKEKLYIKDFIGLTFILLAIILTFSRSIIVLTVFSIIISLFIRKKQVIPIVFSIFLSVLASIILVYYFDLGQVSKRLAETTFKVSEWQTRLLYYSDALDMIKRFPLGTGHLGYYYIQKAFQTGSMYSVKYVHSNILQVVLDIGIVGGLIFVIFFGYNVIFQKDIFLKFSLILLFGHGLIDFDFEFISIIILIILIIDLHKVKKVNLKYKKTIYTLVVAKLVVFTYAFIITFFVYNENYEFGVKYYPLYTDAKYGLLKEVNGYNLEGLLLAKSISDSNNYHIGAKEYLRDYYRENKELDKATSMAKEVMFINVLKIEQVETYSDILIEYSIWAIDNQEYDLAQDLLYEVTYLGEYVQKLAKDKFSYYNVNHTPNLIITDTLNRNLKKAWEYLDWLKNTNNKR